MTTKSKSTKSGHTLWFWVAVVAAVVVVALLLQSDTFNDLLEEGTDWAKDVMREHPVSGAIVFFVLSALSAMIGFVSSAVLVPPANEIFGKPLTFLLLWGGWWAGAVLAYGAGWLARPLLVRLGYGKTLADYESFVSKRTRFWMILVFCVAVPSEIPGYMLGGVHYPFLKFLAAMGIAEALYALGVVIAGESILDANPMVLLLTAGIMIAIAAGAGLVLRSSKKGNK